MSGAWRNCTLGEAITLQRGFDLPKQQRGFGEVPIVSSSGISGTHNVAKVSAPGVVTGRYGTLGKSFYITEDFWPLNTTLFVRDFKGNEPRFISYLLKTLGFENQNVAGAVPGVNRNFLHMLPVKLPPLDQQVIISSILSAYDDLIENNTRRIRILEEMAQSLYREWFVHFRFPGYEKVKLVNSTLGKIPEGWQINKLRDACIIIMGQSPKSEFYNEDSEGLPFHQGVKDFGARFPTDRIYCTVTNRIAEARDILFSVRAPVGRINLTNKRIVIGRGLSAIRSKAGCQAFVFQQLKERFQEEDSMGGGTIFKSVTKDDMHNIDFISPPATLINEFENIVIPMFSEIENLITKNSNLRRTRNLLLPSFISGNIDAD